MPRFINPIGKSTFGIGICARCSRKFSLDDLYSDPNAPGLKVCREDLDEYDPYRLPARQTENISLPFTRPDTRIEGSNPVPNPDSLFGKLTTGLDTRITEEGEQRTVLPPLPDEVII